MISLVFSVRFRVCSRKQNRYKVSLQTSDEGAIKLTLYLTFIARPVFSFDQRKIGIELTLLD
jgi:hypothetical protein